MAWVLEHSESTGTARLVLISLSNHASEKNRWECWPASRTTAHEAGVKSHATVLAALDRLVELGELEVLERGGPRRSMRVRLTFMPERSENDHTNGQQLTAAVSPDEPQRSAQTDQNRKEPEATVRESPPPSKAKTKTRMVEDWEPSETTKEWARREFPQYAKRAVLEHFRDHHVANGTRFVDWDRAFQTWVRRQPQFERTNGSGPARTYL